MTYNVKPAVKAAFVLLTFVALAGCEAPTKARTVGQAPAATNCNCNSTTTLRQADEGESYAPLRRAHTATRAVTRTASRASTGHARASYASRSTYSSSSYRESEYYSSSYTSQSSVSGSASSSSYRASGYTGAGSHAATVRRSTSASGSASAAGWIDGFGKHYAVGQSYGAGYPVYRDGGPGAAYLDVQTDDRWMNTPYHGYNFREGLSNGY